MKYQNGFIGNSKKGISMMFHTEAKGLFIKTILCIAHGASWAMQVVFAQRFFDDTQRLVRGEIALSMLFISMLAMILAYMFTQIMNGVDNGYANIFKLAFDKHKELAIFKRVENMSALEFEDPKMLEEMNKARAGGNSIYWFSVTFLDLIFFYITYFSITGVYFFTLRPSLVSSIILIFVPSILAYMVQVKAFKELEDAAAPLRRKSNYYLECITDLKETRFLGATSYFEKLYYASLKKLNHLVFKVQLRKSLTSLFMECVTGIGYGVILFMLFLLVMRQDISIGAFVAILGSMKSLFDFMSEAISERFESAFENTALVSNYFSFVEGNIKSSTKKQYDAKSDIVIQDVSFKYPLAKNYALNHLNMRIKAGETVAIVGENGSGKSTLCRLLLGLYPTTSGNIKIGEDSLNTISNEQFSAIFQNYCKYKLSLRDNISISKKDKKEIDDELITLLNLVGLDMEKKEFTNGLETNIGREFDGIELSGGQWQRLAIVRGLFRENQFVILDEPTSAIDPLEETKLYNQFKKICENKTAVIVTHRLGSARIADRIIVLKNGFLAEEGTHEHLMQKNGEYRKIFEAQSQWYT